MHSGRCLANESGPQFAGLIPKAAHFDRNERYTYFGDRTLLPCNDKNGTVRAFDYPLCGTSQK